MSDYWFTSDYGKQFIEPHALAAAAGYDDGAKHNVEGLNCWSVEAAAIVYAINLQRFNESRKLLLDFRAKRLPIRATAQLRLQRFHYYTHLRFGSGAKFSNGFAHDFRQFVRAHRLRQVSVQKRQFFLLFVSQFGPAAFFETFDRILAL